MNPSRPATRERSGQTAHVASLAELQRMLADDVPFGDLTTEALDIGHLPGEMTFIARDSMTLALVEEAASIIELAGCRVELRARSGDDLPAGSAILTARGAASGLHRSWKVAQTLIETWSGVASAARSMTLRLRAVAPETSVACTRKHIPGVKPYAVAAVKAGGAIMHRMGLSETVVVFPQHLSFIDDRAWTALVVKLRRAAPERKLVVEVESVDDGVAAARAGFDVVQAERFKPSEIAELAGKIDRSIVIAAAGGIDADNAVDYAIAGAKVLVTSWPYSARPRDVQVRMSRSR